MIIYDQTVDINSGNNILLFSTEWCPDCIVLKNYIGRVVEANKEWNFIFIDSDINPTVAADFSVRGIPSFVALKDGQRVSDLISGEPKPEEMINEWISSIE